jgi:hypothetical protein
VISACSVSSETKVKGRFVRLLGQNKHRSKRQSATLQFFCPQSGRLEISCGDLRSGVVFRQRARSAYTISRKVTKSGYWRPIRRMASSTWAGPCNAGGNSRVVARLDRKRLGQDTFTTKWNLIRGVFDEQTRRKPLVFAADASRPIRQMVIAWSLMPPRLFVH